MVIRQAIRLPGPSNTAIAVILLTFHVTLLLISSRLQFPTRNEVAHVPAGLVCWETGNYSLYKVNPPLWKMLATLPTYCLGPKLDGLRLPATPGDRPEWGDAHTFSADNADRYFTLIWSARLAGIAWSLLGGWIIYCWAGQLYGDRGGLLAVALWCFGPNVLAHAPLVTPDMPAAVAGLTATYVFWGYLRHGTWGLTVAAGVLLGVAQLTKFTLLILYAVWPVLFVLHALDRYNDTFRHVRLRTRLVQAVSIAALSLLTINVGYEFDGTFRPLAEFQFVSRTFTGEPEAEPKESDAVAGNRFRETWFGRIPVLVPADYLIGIDVQRRDFEGQLPASYLRGEWRDHGWWYYYLYALAVKVPLGTWALVLWGIALTPFRKYRAGFADELTLWLPAIAVLVLVSSQTGFNHHSRYVLPALPFVCVATGKLGQFLAAQNWKAGTVVTVLVASIIVSSLRVYPHSLSYFNELAGGPDRGADHLVDSNIDWGQDLFFFQAWAERHPEARPLGLAYYNFIDCRVIGASYDPVPLDPRPGWFAVDIHSLKAGQHKYFERFTSVAKAGYSIFIYHVSPDDAASARREMGLPPLPDGPSERK
jgi:4-amino-4-deoxy-L-arabinose transferase-like glycosyltransferase